MATELAIQITASEYIALEKILSEYVETTRRKVVQSDTPEIRQAWVLAKDLYASIFYD